MNEKRRCANEIKSACAHILPLCDISIDVSTKKSQNLKGPAQPQILPFFK